MIGNLVWVMLSDLIVLRGILLRMNNGVEPDLSPEVALLDCVIETLLEAGGQRVSFDNGGAK